MRFALTAAATCVALAAAVVGLALSGYYEVSALSSHGGAVEWFLVTARERSIAARAAGVEVPALDDPRLAGRGRALYRRWCVDCHGAPGVPTSATGQGLNPPPPELVYADYSGERAAAEAFWVIDNGIRMTGMPSYGLALRDEEIWALVAFLRRLPETSPEEYAAPPAPAAR